VVKGKIIKIIDKENKKIEVEVLTSFKSLVTNREYLLYTPFRDKKGSSNIYASIIIRNEEGVILEAGLSELDEEIIKNFLESFKEGAKDGTS